MERFVKVEGLVINEALFFFFFASDLDHMPRICRCLSSKLWADQHSSTLFPL